MTIFPLNTERRQDRRVAAWAGRSARTVGHTHLAVGDGVGAGSWLLHEVLGSQKQTDELCQVVVLFVLKACTSEHVYLDLVSNLKWQDILSTTVDLLT